MHYTVTAQDKDGRTIWTHQVPATSFDTAVSIVTRYGVLAPVMQDLRERGAGVHSLLVTKG